MNPSTPQRSVAKPPPAEQVFAANGMATRWQIFVESQMDAGYALRATTAAFQEMERLERLLSRFIANSEISQLNTARGQPVVVTPETWDVLKTAADMSRSTGGALG